jgi:putative oxidoreductase
MRDLAALLARAAVSAIFLWGGAHKLFDIPGTASAIRAAGLPQPAALAWATAALELLGGVLLLLGARARSVALLLAGFLVPVTYVFHWEPGNPAQWIQFLKNLAILGGLLEIAAFGAGRFSLDRG